jgi:predicted esterase
MGIHDNDDYKKLTDRQKNILMHGSGDKEIEFTFNQRFGGGQRDMSHMATQSYIGSSSLSYTQMGIHDKYKKLTDRQKNILMHGSGDKEIEFTFSLTWQLSHISAHHLSRKLRWGFMITTIDVVNYTFKYHFSFEYINARLRR